MEAILILSFCHWVADFVLQSDHVAANKSRDSIVLAFHCLVYGIVLASATTCLSIPILPFKDSWGMVFVGVLSIYFTTHFVTDYITSRINSLLWKKELRHWFFVSVGFDQWLHVVVILLISNWIGIVSGA